jgi:hypothetical protein
VANVVPDLTRRAEATSCRSRRSDDTLQDKLKSNGKLKEGKRKFFLCVHLEWVAPKEPSRMNQWNHTQFQSQWFSCVVSMLVVYIRVYVFGLCLAGLATCVQLDSVHLNCNRTLYHFFFSLIQ